MSRTLFTSRAGGDLKDEAIRERLRQELSLERVHFMRQTHSDEIEIVGLEGDNFSCDALITSQKGVGIAALAADCMPITFSSAALVGVAHVGRLGLIKGLAAKTVLKMQELGATDIEAIIGPSICGKCYEVSPDMYLAVTSDLPATSTSERSHSLDLQRGVTFQLEELGVTVRNLEICTLENSDYFSFRGGSVDERQAGIIAL